MDKLFHQKVETIELPFYVTIKHVKPLMNIVDKDGKTIPLLRIYADDDNGERCELRFYRDYGKALAEQETFKPGQRVFIQAWRPGNMDQNFPHVIVYRFEITKQANEYLLILSDVGDAFFPDPREVEETYATIEEARNRIREVTETHLKYTYTPITLIHPDGTEEDVYSEDEGVET